MATYTLVDFSVLAGNGKRDSPCSGFSLCCIVHLLLLPDVLLLFGVVKLADPLFAASLESGRVGLREQGVGGRAIRMGSGNRSSCLAGGDPVVTLTLLSSASRLKFISAILSNVALQRENNIRNIYSGSAVHYANSKYGDSWLRQPLKTCTSKMFWKPNVSTHHHEFSTVKFFALFF